MSFSCLRLAGPDIILYKNVISGAARMLQRSSVAARIPPSGRPLHAPSADAPGTLKLALKVEMQRCPRATAAVVRVGRVQV